MLLTKDRGERSEDGSHDDLQFGDHCLDNGDINNDNPAMANPFLSQDNTYLSNGPPTTCSFQDYLDDSLDTVPFAAPDFSSHQLDSSSPENKHSPDDGSADENSMVPNGHSMVPNGHAMVTHGHAMVAHGHPNGPYPAMDHFITDQTQRDLG